MIDVATALIRCNCLSGLINDLARAIWRWTEKKHAGEVDDVDDDDDDHADEDEDGEDDDNNDGDSDSDNDVDDCTTGDDDDGVDDVKKKVMLRLILAGIVVENPFAKCFREKTTWLPNVENLECSLFTRN
jgi:hypothetical protein